MIAELLWLALVVLALVLLNGLFVAAEFAIIAASRPAVAGRATRGELAAIRVQHVLAEPQRLDRYIATAQIGITFASLGLGMYGEHKLAGLIEAGLLALGAAQWPAWLGAHLVATIAAVGLLTYLHIVFGEMIPKALALMHAERTAMLVSGPMAVVRLALFPLVLVLNTIGNRILAWMGVIRSEAAGAHYLSPEELQFVVEESQQQGLIGPESGRMLRELIEFSELSAGEVMVPRVRVAGLPLGAGQTELRRILRNQRHTRYPIYEESIDHIIGVVHIKDVLRLLHEGGRLERERVRPVGYVPETASLDTVLEAMRAFRTQMVVVMDEHGGTAGIISMEDLCAEAVGEVEEGQDELPDLVREADGSLRVNGLLRLDDLGEALGRELEHDEVDTVSGLVLMLLERPPQVGDRVRWQDLDFEVLEIRWHGVQVCRVRPIDGTSAASPVTRVG